jgi:TPR repeat protein
VFKFVIVLFLVVLAPAFSHAEEHTLPSPTNPAPWLRDKIVILKAMADKGDPDAQYELGKIYFKGNGFKDPNTEAYKWFGMAAEGYRKAAEKGNADAQYHLGDMIYHGFSEGGVELAARWYYRAGKQGNADAMALALRLDPALVHGEHPTADERIQAFKASWDKVNAERTKAESGNRPVPTQAPIAPGSTSSPASK